MISQPNIKINVVGVGGGGCSIVSRIATLLIASEPAGEGPLSSGASDAISSTRMARINQGSDSLISLTAINTDAQALDKCENVNKVLIGKSLNWGLGSGMDPDKGKVAAEADRNSLCEILKKADMTFLVSCLGGGAGSGALPVIADLVARAGSLIVGVVTKPFSFEGNQRAKIAEEAISKIEDKVDSIITFSNDRIVDLAKGKVKFTAALSLVDKVVAEGVKSVADLLITPGIVNIDFSDVKTILGNTGYALIGIGEAGGPDRAAQAARNVLNSPLLTFPINGATGILFNVAGGENLGLMEIKEAADVITESVNKDAKIIFGATRDDALGSKVKITLIAAGLGRTKSAVNQMPDYAGFSYNPMAQESKSSDIQTESKNLPEDSKNDDVNFDIPAFIRKKLKKL